MRYYMKMFVAAVVLVVLPVSPCFGGSLFRKGQEQSARNPVPGGATIYTAVPAEKPPAPKVHDLVKVVVPEVSSAAANGNTKTEKNTKLDASLNTFINWDGSTLNPGGENPKVDLDADLKTNHKAETKKAMSIRATIKAEVMEVLPNGNLQIEVTKTRTVNQETETITLAGVIDPDDISAAGSVFSNDVAQLKLSYTGSGSVSDARKRGALTKVLDFIWPF